MGIAKRVWIRCDGCGNSEASWMEEETVKNAIYVCRQVGYRKINGDWLCGECVEKLKNRKKKKKARS